jgi:hypothetical protein
MEGGPGLTMWTTGPGRRALSAWKVGAGHRSRARDTEGGHIMAKRWKAGTGCMEGGRRARMFDQGC